MGVWPNAMGICGALVVMMSVTGIAMEERHLDAKEKAAKEHSSSGHAEENTEEMSTRL